MNTAEALTILQSQDFLDKLYSFSYHRCDSSHEAEDLCSDIVLAILSAVQKQKEIDSFYAFVWSIARRVYADYSEKRNKKRQILSLENTDFSLESRTNDLDDLIERDADLKMLQSIFKEIAFLSKAYRDVMILYYLDGYSVREIAKRLNIRENTVKQRLFSARQSIRKEVETMNEAMNERSYLLKPVRLAFSGTGAPNGNDPEDKAERLFSQNLIYLCKDRPRTARELSDELCVPMPYIEEELNIQCRGANGSYGILRRLDTGKYALNIPLVDYAEYKAANRIYEQYMPEFCENLKKTLELKKDELLSFPYLSKPKDTGLLMWTILSRICWDLHKRVQQVLQEKYFSDIAPVQRSFSCAAIAFEGDQHPDTDIYGNDGISANSVCGYQSVLVSNLYGKRIEKHFSCGHNLTLDQKLLMTLRAIGGLNSDDLTEEELEIAAKAIECGYLRKRKNTAESYSKDPRIPEAAILKPGNIIPAPPEPANTQQSVFDPVSTEPVILEPAIIVIDGQDEPAFYRLCRSFNNGMEPIIDQIAGQLAAFMRRHLPEHLIREFSVYHTLIADARTESAAIEECLKLGVLSEPVTGSEGVLMIVHR